MGTTAFNNPSSALSLYFCPVLLIGFRFVGSFTLLFKGSLLVQSPLQMGLGDKSRLPYRKTPLTDEVRGASGAKRATWCQAEQLRGQGAHRQAARSSRYHEKIGRGSGKCGF